jgi:hypothetical protein
VNEFWLEIWIIFLKIFLFDEQMVSSQGLQSIDLVDKNLLIID